LKTNLLVQVFPEQQPSEAFKRFSNALRGQDGYKAVYATGTTLDGQGFTVYIKGRIQPNSHAQPTVGLLIYVGETLVGKLQSFEQLSLFLAHSKWQLNT
jgi:hypothetical protein